MRSRTAHQSAGSRLGELYAEHSRSIFAYALHLLGDWEDAEDVTQTAFLHAHRALQRGDELVSPRAWLATVVKRQALNRWRDHRETPSDELDDDTPASAVAPELLDQLAQVRAVLLTLPETQHQAFVLRHWSGLSQAEIAAVLETSESAVESLLVRARTAVLAAGPVADGCVDIRDRIATGAELSPPERRHVDGCSGCRAARQRLTRVAAAAAVLSLAPRVHVAQALAAAAPGFAGGAGLAGAGGGMAAAGTKAGAVSALAKAGGVAVAVTAAVAVGAHSSALHRLPRFHSPVRTSTVEGRPAASSSSTVHDAATASVNRSTPAASVRSHERRLSHAGGDGSDSTHSGAADSGSDSKDGGPTPVVTVPQNDNSGGDSNAQGSNPSGDQGSQAGDQGNQSGDQSNQTGDQRNQSGDQSNQQQSNTVTGDSGASQGGSSGQDGNSN